MNYVLFFEVIQSKPMLKLNEILNQALLKDIKEEIGIHSQARPFFFILIFQLIV